MCTASWLIHDEGFELFFNRDESVRRGRAEPPRQHALEGVPALAPTDADAGGTWIGVNAFGLAVALLNSADARTEEAERESRGLLVRALLATHDVAAARAALRRRELERHRGFTLFLLDPEGEPVVQTWDGRQLTLAEARAPLSSSSLDAERARFERARVLARVLGEPGDDARATLERFQRSHEPEEGPWSPCMHRVDAATVSATQLRVERAAVSMRYADGPPCRTAFGPWLVLERR